MTRIADTLPRPGRAAATTPSAVRAGTLGRLAARARRLHPELVALLLLAAALDLWALSRNGWANDYYSAAVRSMSTDWHDFLYASFDPSGTMTVDKPPLALWVQALSVRAFGWHPLSMLVPQALMGVASVALVWDLTRRRWGRAAGTVGGLVLAITPITVAISRHNNPDALLVLCCVAALWCAVRAFEDGHTRWLVLAGLAVGLGFEAKMAVALMVVPGIAAAWLWVAPRGRLAALRQLGAGGAAMVVAGGAWPLLVALTPAASRPWISGTSDNSILSLILGYNGLGRLDGQAGGPGGGGPGGGFGGGGVFGGQPGILRLLNASLGGQAGWLLGAAVVGGLGMLVVTRLRRTDPRTGWLVAVGGAFLTTAVAFSAARGIFHPYYTSLLAPFTAALVGGTVGLVRSGDAVGATLGGHAVGRLIAPLAVAGAVATELAVLHGNPGDLGWLPPVLAVAGVGVVAACVVGIDARVQTVALAAGLGVLLLGPAIWSVQTLGHATSSTFPAGGPADVGFGGGPPGGRMAGGAMPGGGATGMPNGSATPGGTVPGTGSSAMPDGGMSGGATGMPNGSATLGGTMPGTGSSAMPDGGMSGGATGMPNGSAMPGGNGMPGGIPGGSGGRRGSTAPGAGATVGGAGRARRGFGGGGFGGFGGPGDGRALDQVVRYVRRHGGGTIAVSSQTGAASAIIASGADVAGIGGFSGRESAVTPSWLADRVAAGKLRWFVVDGQGAGGGFPGGGLGAGGALPGGTLPGGRPPRGTLPGGTLPGGTLPGGRPPRGTLPGGGRLPGGGSLAGGPSGGSFGAFPRGGGRGGLPGDDRTGSTTAMAAVAAACRATDFDTSTTTTTTATATLYDCRGRAAAIRAAASGASPSTATT